MKKLLVLLISLTIFLSFPNIIMAYEKEIKNLSILMAESILKAGKKTIAVVDFTDLQGNVTELGRFLAEELSVALAIEGGFEVIDRTHLKSILQEHKLSTTGLIDPQTARKLGKIAGVETLISGTITPFGDSVRLSVKILGTDTAKVIGATTGNIPKTKAIDELLARGIEAATPTASISSTTPTTLSAKGKVIESEGFIVKPIGCERNVEMSVNFSRRTFTACTITFLNAGKEGRMLELRSSHIFSEPKSFLYDNLGNQYDTTIRIGQKYYGSIGTFKHTFVSGVSTNVQFLAENVEADAANMTASIAITGFKSPIVVRNIPFVNNK